MNIIYGLSFFKNFIWLLFFVTILNSCIRTKDNTTYYVSKPIATHTNGQNYVGSESCFQCHEDIYKSHINTTHYLSSQLADSITVKGNFAKGLNTLKLSEMLEFRMSISDSVLYQKAFFSYNDQLIYKHKIDIVIGSGTKGQSYLTWNNDELYQLQASYFSPSDVWINSPGAKKGIISRLRPVNNRCLECHTTFAKSTNQSELNNTYDKKKILYGIDCERCHGPSASHVDYHKNNPEISVPKHIVLHDTLSRQQRLDACALCHSGLRKYIQPPFTFITGDTLDNYSLPENNDTNFEELDVHGNQYGLLTSSKCFKMTNKMDCTTCHSPHENQRNNKTYFNQKCMECHSSQATICDVDDKLMSGFKNNCMECHMPLTSSKTMSVQLKNDEDETSVKVRTHKIGIYPEDTWNLKN